MRSIIYLADIDMRLIPGSTGKKEKYIAKMTAVTADVLYVGQNTFWQAKVANIQLNYSIVLRQSLYNNEKYIYLCVKLHEVENTGKAKDENNVTLNVKESAETQIENLIKRWIDENPII